MLHNCSKVAALLFVALPAFAQEVLIDGPYVALYDISDHSYSASQLAALRASIEQEQKQQIDTCKKDEHQLKDELDSARAKLKEVDASSARQNLHSHIAALAKLIEEKNKECEHRIPLQFEI